MSIEQGTTFRPEMFGTARPAANLLAAPEYLQLLVEFTERWQRAATLEEVYQAALDAITTALYCPRASLLLFDQTHRMRFVAWRGLSDAYRHAVDGHSPWTRETKNPQPVLIEDIEAADLEADLKRIILGEGIRACAFIPLLERGRLLGKFMIYYDQVHRFTDSEVDLALTIARQLGYSVERTYAAQAASRLIAIVESSEDAIISKDLDGNITTWNHGAEKIYGYTAAETIGKPITLLMPPDRYDEEPGILARLRQGETIDHYETVRRRKDGTLIDVSLTVSPVRDATGRIIGASKIARDISDRKRAEHALKDSERRLRELIAAIPAAIYTTDAEGKITFFNDAAVRLACQKPEIGGDWSAIWKLYHPDGSPIPREQRPTAIALREGRGVRGVEAVAELADGTRVPIIPYPTPLFDWEGNVVGAINMLVDISERKEAETHQRMLLSELNHRVKNNMQMIQSLLDAAARQTGYVDPARIFEEASRRVAAMSAAQRVLYATKEATHFGADEFLRSVCQTAKETLPANVEIVFVEASGELLNDVAMPLALILNELLTNAAKYGARNGKAIIRTGLFRDDDAHVLYVEDDGPGFDLASVRKQASGLQLVYGLAGQIRGRLEVTNNPTRCSVRLQ